MFLAEDLLIPCKCPLVEAYADEAINVKKEVARKASERLTTISGRDYTARQLEHVGDSVLRLVAGIMVLETFRSHQGRYFYWVGRLATNANLVDGAQREIEIGTVFFESGFEAARETAQRILAETVCYMEMLRFVAHEEASARAKVDQSTREHIK